MKRYIKPQLICAAAYIILSAIITVKRGKFDIGGEIFVLFAPYITTPIYDIVKKMLKELWAEIRYNIHVIRIRNFLFYTFVYKILVKKNAMSK
jgi:hypothetical protein